MQQYLDSTLIALSPSCSRETGKNRTIKKSLINIHVCFYTEPVQIYEHITLPVSHFHSLLINHIMNIQLLSISSRPLQIVLQNIVCCVATDGCCLLKGSARF